MDEMTPERLAMDRVERGLAEVVAVIEELDSERPDKRLAVSANALRACIEILQGKL